MAKRPLPAGHHLPDEVSSVRPEKVMRVPDDMPERLKDIVTKKQSLLEQIWKDQRNMIQYERSYLTACSYGNVLRGYTPVQAEIPFEGVSQCKFSLSCTRMRWYVAKCAELNNRVKEDLKGFKEQMAQQHLNANKRQQLMGSRLQEDPLGSTAFNSSMQTSATHGPQLSGASTMPPKRLSMGGYHERGGGGWNDSLR